MANTNGMLINSRSTKRYGFKCTCCQTAPGKARTTERRQIKRSQRNAFKAETRKFLIR